MSAIVSKAIFISAEGSDDFSGLSSAKPIKSIDRLNVLIAESGLHAGDRILFRRGDVFNGELRFRNISGTKEKPIYIGSYGCGKRPLIKVPTITKGVKSEDNLKIVLETIKKSGIKPKDYSVKFDRPKDTLTYSAIHIDDSHYITLEEIDFYGDNDSITWYSHYSNPNAVVWFYNCTGITIRNLLIKGNTKTRNKNTIADRTDTVFYDSWHDYVQYPYLGNDYYSLICANAFDDSVTDYSNVLVENVVSTGVIAMSVDGSQFTVRDCKFYDSPAWAFIITGRNGKCINCEAVNTGYGQNSAGNAAFMTVSSQNITFENIRALEIKRGPQPFDGAGFDFEANTQNIVLKNSSFKNVEGPAIMIFVGGKNAGFLIENTDIENCCYAPTNEGSINMCAGPEAYINDGVIRNVYIKKCGDTDYYSGYSDNTKPLTEYPGVVFENCIFA